MKRLLLLLFATILFSLLLKAQQQPSKDYYSNLLKKNYSAIGIAELSNWRISNAHFDEHANATYIYLQQTYKGIDIENAINAICFKNEKPVTGNLTEIKNFTVINNKITPSLDAKTALLKAANALGLQVTAPVTSLKNDAESKMDEFGPAGISFNNIPVKLLWTNTDDKQANLKLAYEVLISSTKNNSLWKVLVDAETGSVINKINLTVYEKPSQNVEKQHRIFVYEDEAQQNFSGNSTQDKKSINSSKYRVIPYPYESPSYIDFTLVTNPWAINQNQNANTLKWNNDGTTDYAITRGNNVYVQDDHDASNSTNGYSPTSLTSVPDLDFDFTPDYTKEPTDTANMNANLTNLFYWTNLMHDLSYQYGFDEASGNFQNSNLSRGGEENDYVVADTQDSSGFANANFTTPVDGSKPRMQMFLFDPSRYRDFFVNLPANYSGYHTAQKDDISTNNKFIDVGPVTANVVYFNDSTGAHTGCTGATNPADLKNKIAYIDRGTCTFVTKFQNAQKAGASGVIVGNYTGDNTVIIMGGPDNTIKIPGVFVSGSDADSLRNYLNTAILVNATLYGPQTDGEIDNTIPTHEYTHGISNRLVGGANNVSCLQNKEQMGEGWSDWYALMITQNWAKATLSGDHVRTIGNYAIGLDTNGSGIRTYPYSTNMSINPWTYDSLATLPTSAALFDEHTVGEMWCEMLWELTWKLASTYGIGGNIFDATETGGNNIALSLVTQGMKLTKCSPGFVDARNGILEADTALYGGKYSRQIWEVFAKRGLGFSASEGRVNNTKDGVPAYDLPAVLPVTFGSFTAEKKGSTALLKWITAQELNTNKFIVERSADGKPFTALGEVKAAGNSSVSKSYQFVDASPLTGNNIYHIKEVDNDGKVNLSDMRLLNFNNVKPSIKIFPNPATNIVLINIPGNIQNLTVRLLSNAGQSIKNYTMTGETLNIDVSRFASGVYNILITGKDYSTKYKLVIQ